MVKKVQESKAGKSAKIQKASGKGEKKWTKGKTKYIVRRGVEVDQEVFAKIEKDIPRMSVITKAAVAEKYNLNVGLSQRILKFFHENGLIQLIFSSSKCKIYGKVVKAKEEVPAEKSEAKEVTVESG
jgi:ribosomal protein S25